MLTGKRPSGSPQPAPAGEQGGPARPCDGGGDGGGQVGAVAVRGDGVTDDLRLRVISSLVLAPLALFGVWLGGPVFAGMIAAGGVILAHEWSRMTEPEASSLTFVLTAAAAAGGVIAASAGYAALGLVWIAGVAIIGAGVAWFRGAAGQAVFGAMYIGWPCVGLIVVRLSPDHDGFATIVMLFAAVWGADIGAYGAGRWIGGPKLAPSISENKTWAGLVGGLVLAVLGGVVASALTGWPGVWWLAVLAALGLGAFGLMGDLLESALKRRYGVKDTGALIPGHGGLLDRVDGLMVSAAVLAVWLAGIAPMGS